mmetsp:Transcript_82971/g.231498  ORF Transcript_82971/g.231498 Transcript_82971/m.231498 type:complete len:233 (-) Transcript_82971:86-784(-)
MLVAALGPGAGGRVDLHFRHSRTPHQSQRGRMFGFGVAAVALGCSALAGGGVMSYVPSPSAPVERRTAVLAAATVFSFRSTPLVQAYELRTSEERDPDSPPVPSSDPFIRRLQAKSWALEPYSRTRIYLEAVKRKIQPNPFMNKKYFVRWAPDLNSFDVLNEKSRNEAVDLGKILKDNDLSNDGDEFEAFTYASEEDRAWVKKNLPVDDAFIELPSKLVETIKKIKSQKFDG